MPELSLTERLARWLAQARRSRFETAERQAACRHVLDWLGSALAGSATTPGRALTEYALSQPEGACHMLGTGRGGSAELAALVNGGHSHVVEMDDLDRSSVLHPGAVIIPAALAAAESVGATGREFLEAVIAGYEIAIRIGQAVGKKHYFYFHNTATCGVFGAAAAAGWLFGLTEQQFTWALGNAGTQASGLWQFNADGDMSKHLHAGRAAANGVLAATLAARGFTGARHILEGKRGFFAATAPGARPEVVLHGLEGAGASGMKINRVSLKPHASCRHTHAAIDALLALRFSGGRGVHRIEVDTYQAALDLCDNPVPYTPYAARFSLQFCAASAWQRGHAGLDDFTPEAIQDPAVRALLPLVALSAEKDLEARYPQEWPCRIRLFVDGETILSHEVSFPRGDPENPLSPAEVEQKFRSLAAYGQQGPNADSWINWVAGLDSERSIHELAWPQPDL
jgi:2-methylcitrate dehydratase PrpD